MTKELRNAIRLTGNIGLVMPTLKHAIRERDDMRSNETQEEWEKFCAKYAEENCFPILFFERAEQALNSDEYQFKGKMHDLVEKSIDLIKGKISCDDFYGKYIKDE